MNKQLFSLLVFVFIGLTSFTQVLTPEQEVISKQIETTQNKLKHQNAM